MPDIMPFGAASPAEAAEQPPNFLDKLFAGIINGTVSIPKHVIQAAAQAGPPGLRREDVTDIPGSAQPVDPLVKEATDAALNIAGTSVPFATSGAAGVFGGRLAQNADLNALQRAEKMATAGADRKAIWDETGWFKGSDDKWRFEIPDYRSTMHPAWHEAGVPNYRELDLADSMKHPPLFAAYPDLKELRTVTERAGGGRGSYTPEVPATPSTFSRAETINIQAPNAPDARSVGLHEVQHAIQEREGFASGGSPSMFSQADDAKLARDALSYRRELEGLDPSLTPKQKDEIVAKRYRDMGAEDWMVSPAAREVAHDVEGNPPETLRRVMELYGLDKSTSGFTPRQLYHELPGEIEARNVQARRDMTPAELKAKPPWETAGLDARPIMSELFGTGRVGSLEGGAPSNLVQRIVPEDAGRSFGIPSKIPDSDTFRRAIANTPGAAVDAEAMTLPLKRTQHPDQELSESVRGGVFYQPGGPGGFSYTGRNGYGGSQTVEGTTAIKAPLFVKGATGGKAPEAAYDSLLGKGAYQDMRTDALKSLGGFGVSPARKEEAVSAFLEKYAPELAPNAYEIIRNSKQGNQLAYALQEAAVASAARKHGHDAVVGYSTKRGPEKEPFISEVFDTRESHYPSPAGDYQTWPASMFGDKVGALK